MLMLNSQAWAIEGIQVFADHADPKQSRYLPGPVQQNFLEGLTDGRRRLDTTATR